MSDTYNIFNELETILYKVGDAPTQPTEDQLMNMLIGVMDLHKVRYEKMWASWNEYTKNNIKSDITI
ncbi:MAG: hypothetical protein CBC02_008230 [Flavobacteriaceae bacterium TMED42]|nr:MAG: hypothetical protein CBC02_008230 [Flavobacteriaceae bacterium TMED42]